MANKEYPFNEMQTTATFVAGAYETKTMRGCFNFEKKNKNRWGIR
jgi:hypothetical protein